MLTLNTPHPPGPLKGTFRNLVIPDGLFSWATLGQRLMQCGSNFGQSLMHANTNLGHMCIHETTYHK